MWQWPMAVTWCSPDPFGEVRNALVSVKHFWMASLLEMLKELMTSFIVQMACRARGDSWVVSYPIPRMTLQVHVSYIWWYGRLCVLTLDHGTVAEAVNWAPPGRLSWYWSNDWDRVPWRRCFLHQTFHCRQPRYRMRMSDPSLHDVSRHTHGGFDQLYVKK